MSYARKTIKTKIDVGGDAVWVTVFWEGRPDQDECHNRAFYAFGDEPEKMRRLLKRGRQMQDIIIARSWQQSKCMVATGATGRDLPSMQRPINAHFAADVTAVELLTYDPDLFHFIQERRHNDMPTPEH